MSRFRFACVAMGMATAVVVPAWAENITANEYQLRMKVYQAVEPLGKTPFGENINLYTGEVSFSQTDVTFEGTGLPIVVTREMKKSDPLGGVSAPTGFVSWDLSLPYIETLTPGREGWQTAAADNLPTHARCSNFTAMFSPPEGFQPRYGGVHLNEWWRGYQLVIPGAGTQDLLKSQPADARKPSTGAYVGTTHRFWQVGCQPATSNRPAAEGEAFVVLSPDGTRYYMDHLVYGDYFTLAYNIDPYGDKAVIFKLERKVARMYATRIVDRFGNWLAYKWEGERVTEMRASDGTQSERVVALDWDVAGTRIEAVRMQPNTPDQRTWTYAYDTSRLTAITLPDGSQWSFSGSGKPEPLAGVPITGCFDLNQTPAGSGASPPGQIDASITMRHPSGLVGTFNMAQRLHAQTSVPSSCMGFPGEVYESDNPYFLSRALISKTLSGPGVVTGTWTYEYEPAHASVDRYCQPPTTCQNTTYADVTDPAGSVTRYTYSTRYDALEGQLLRVDYNLVNGVASKTDLTEYHTPLGLRPASGYGGSMGGGGNTWKAADTSPARKRTTLLQGRAFIWEVPATCQADGERGTGIAACFDQYFRPTRTIRFSGVSP